jgi:hypothetical protein
MMQLVHQSGRSVETATCVVGVGHAGVMCGFDGRAVAIAALAVVLAVTFGALAGSHAGAGAGALAALAGLIPPAVLAAAVERRARIAARANRQEEIRRKYAPPKPTGRREGER